MALFSAIFISITNWFYSERVKDDIEKLKNDREEHEKNVQVSFHEHEDDGDGLTANDASMFQMSAGGG